MLSRIFLILLLSSKLTKSEILDTMKTINLKELTRIEITDYEGLMDKNTFIFFPHIYELEVRNSNATVKTDFLQSLTRLRKLTFQNNHVIKIDTNATGCCEYIKELRLINNKINDLKIADLGCIHHIFILVLKEEIVPILRKDDFLGSPRIMQMNITYSNLKTIEDGAFNGLNELKVLNLEGNEIESISKEVLKNLKVLETLVLGKNKLKEFTSVLVKDLDWLRYIDVSYNPIEKLAVADIRDVTLRVKIIDVTGINGTTQDIMRFGQYFSYQ